MILLCFYGCAEFQYAYGSKNDSIITCREEIYGKWEVSGRINNLNLKNQKEKIKEEVLTPEIWIFNENGILNMEKIVMRYELERFCSKLIIQNNEIKIVFKIQLSNGQMHLIQDSHIADELGVELKKIK
jgi:hypothetical protein